ncbi:MULTISPECIES: hypothetical protein [Streptomyces]|uniref:Transposase n=2 Tax=Streptomyces TaxID=1883 RepID=A0ABV9J8P0_9ACTN
MATRTTTSRDVAAELAFLSRALKAPALLDAADRLAERATAESWTHQEYLAACLQREVVLNADAGRGDSHLRNCAKPSPPWAMRSAPPPGASAAHRYPKPEADAQHQP